MHKTDWKSLLKKHAQGIKIDLGGGGAPQPGFLNVDIRPLPQVDVVQDFEEFPWVIPSEVASLVMASHLVEHINPAKFGFINFMNEVHRILKPGGQFMIAYPYAGSPGMYQDPTHINFCNERTWAYFDPLEAGGHLYRIYEPSPFRIAYSTYNQYGNGEVVLEKRRDDVSYHVDGKLKYAKRIAP